MKSFLLKLSTAILLLLFLLGGLFFGTRSWYYQRKNIYAKKNILTQQAPKQNNYLLVLGNSHAQFAINTSLMKSGGINMASPSQGMQEDFAILKQAYQINPKIGQVLITYSYHSNTNLLYNSTRDEEINRMFEYNYAYKIDYPKNAFTVKKQLGHLSNWAIFITKAPANRNDLDQLGNLKEACIPQTFTISGVKERVAQHFNNQELISNTPNPYFDSIRTFCQNKQIPFTVVIPPYTQAYTNELKETQPQAFAFINQLATQTSPFYKIIDCRNIFNKYESSFFKDTDHLSPCGRDSFSVFLINLL